MMQDDLDKMLAEAELLAARLALQAEQEEALRQVVPIRYQSNLAAFEKYMPDVANTFRDYKPVRAFRLFCTGNGIPNLEWLDTSTAIYGEDPYLICSQQIKEILAASALTRVDFSEEYNPVNFFHLDYLNEMVRCFKNADQELPFLMAIPDSIPMMMMFGIGLGYQLAYLYEAKRIDNLFLFEPDLDLFFASLHCFDWVSLLDHLAKENMGLHIFLGQDEKSIMSDLLMAIHRRGAFLAINTLPCWHYPSPEIFKLIDTVKREFSLIYRGWGFFEDNIFSLSHCMRNIETQTPFLLANTKVKKQWRDVPIFVIGNGPSLDSTIDIIKQHQDAAIIVSCGSTISALHKAGIRPDIHVETERTKSVPDFLRLLEDDDYLRDILFLSSDVIHPDCMGIFKRAGLCFKYDEPSAMLFALYFPEARRRAHISGVNPLVSNIGLSISCALGFENIYLFGIDNGYRDGKHHHSSFSSYFAGGEKAVERLTKLVAGGGEYPVAGNFGDEVLTTGLFDSSRRVLGHTLTYYPDVICYNCSDGAMIEGAKPLPADKIIISTQKKLDKSALLDHIYQDLYVPLQIERVAVEDKLDIEFFNKLVDQIVLEWSEPLMNREQVAEIMLHQYGYLVQISETMQRHIYKMLVGSMNYVFALVNMMLYRYQNEEENLRIVAQAIEIVVAYLRKTQQVYPHALDGVDLVDNEVISLFKRGK